MENQETIKCTNSLFLHLIIKKYKKTTILVISVFVISLIVIFLTIGFYPPFLFLPLLIPTLYGFYLYPKAHKMFMIDFAKINNFNYQEKIFLNEVNGVLFTKGHSNIISNVITGNYKNNKIRLFNYKTSVGYERYQKNYHFTVFEVFFEKINFPYIVLNKKSLTNWSKKNAVKINLEEEFAKNYSLFCDKGYEIETLQVFNPNLLRIFNDKKLNFNIEFSPDRIYFYKNFYIRKKDQLNEFYEALQLILNSINPLIDRVKKDFDYLHKYYKK